MQQVRGCGTVVNYYSSGLYQGLWYVAMQPLAESLSGLPKTLRSVRNDPSATFAPATVARTGIQALNALECFHNLGFVHRDQKAGNWMLGIGDEWDEVHLIDFGFAHRLRSPNGTRTPPSTGFQGTYRYASLNQHRRREMTRRYDLWGLFYVLMELGLGRLPWHDVPAPKEEARMQRMKEEYANRETAEAWLRPLPSPFLRVWLHILSLFPDLHDDLAEPLPPQGKLRPTSKRGVQQPDPDPEYDRVRKLLAEVCGGDCSKQQQEWMGGDWPRKAYATPAPPPPPPSAAARALRAPASDSSTDQGTEQLPPPEGSPHTTG